MLKGFWGKKGIPHTATVRTFHSMVVGAGLSGLEAETPTSRELDLLDKAIIQLARKALGSEASFVHTDGSRRSHSDLHIRKRMGIHTVDSLLRSRRLKWWREISTHRDDNEQLLAALLGTLDLEDYESTYTGTTPWIQLIRRDLTEAARTLGSNENADLECARQGDLHILHEKWLAYTTPKACRKVKQWQHSSDTDTAGGDQPPRERHTCGYILPNGDRCTYEGTTQAVATHRRTAHGHVHTARECVYTNECPACRELFTTKEKAKVHFLQAMERGRCPPRRVTHKKKLILNQLRSYYCKMCSRDIQGMDSIRKHSRKHIRAAIRDTE